MINIKKTISYVFMLFAVFGQVVTTEARAENPTRDDSVRYVSARIIYDNYAQVSWTMSNQISCDDFETGDFSLLNWNNAISDYPWTIDSTHAHEGNYCMKSTCEGHGNSASEIEISYFVPADGTMSFFSKISSESTFDVGRFYIDGEKQMECSGEGDWEEHRFDITEGIHWFRWSYLKDASIDNGDDCFYVDQINFLEDDSLKNRDLLYFNLYRRRFEGDTIVMASHLTDSSFIDMSWNALSWGQYSWGVSCTYSGNPPTESGIRWSNALDKDMTTTLEVSATTNTGQIPVGATLHIESHDGQGETYSAQLDENGHALMSSVYRDNYMIQLHLDGFNDYVSDNAISIFGPTSLNIELIECTHDLDTLYVSSTGWAMWNEPDSRSLQYYEIALNDSLVGSSTELHFQFDTDTLVEGNTYQAAVRPVYQSWTGAWITCDWTYRSCQHYPSAIGIDGTAISEGTLISWTYPEADSLLGAVYFREDDYNGLQYLGFTTDNYFIDTLPLQGPGVYWWYVRIVYSGEQGNDYYSMSCPEGISFYIPLGCDAPELLRGETYYTDENDHGALISWGAQPDPVEGWLHYDNGIFHRSIGSEDGAIFWGIKFEPEDLTTYTNCSLTQISLYDIEAGTYQLLVYQGGAAQPGTMTYYQNLELEGTHGWHTVATDTPISISATEPLWIVIGQQGIAYPAAVCSASGEANGRWVSLDGTNWEDLATYNLNFTWMLRAFVTDQTGKSRQLDDEGSSLIGYNLYRGISNDNYSLVAQIPHIEGEEYYEYRDNLSELPEQTYFYQLTAIYDNACESEPAASADNPSNNYVSVEASWDTEENETHNFSLYPNPTTGTVIIEANDIKMVTVTDILGQEIIKVNTHTNLINLDLSSLADGLYTIQVCTANEIRSQAIMIAR